MWWKLFEALVAEAGPPDPILIDSSAVKAHRSAAGGKAGERLQGISRSRGGRTTNIHALTNRAGRPIAFLLTGGNVADCTAGATLLAELAVARMLHGDKRYDSDAIRCQAEDASVTVNIPPKSKRRWNPCFSPALYRDRNAIKRMFCRLKDFRRVATRYDRLASSFLAAVHIAAIVSYRL